MISPEKFCEEAIARLRSEIPGRAIVAASGGIDSTVAAVLTHRAIGDRADALFVDTGLLREGEVDRVRGLFDQVGLRAQVIDASQRFFERLDGVTDPEEKRRRIGAAFIRLFEGEAQARGTDRLVQGTIAPDWIESGGALRDTIKTHHNVGGVPSDSRLVLVEPIRDLYKDEVRSVARHLGIPASDRQPFPGPGLAVRVNGAVTPERVRWLRRANAIVEEEVERAVAAGSLAPPWQYFAVLLDSPTVGVTGDNRISGEAVAVRIVESTDAMTASVPALPKALAISLAQRITRELTPHVVRVLYDLTDKPPATIEWE
jgi:GMP synthase (glutamine-hydrolysing)